MYLLLVLLAIVAGVVLPIQAALNAELGRVARSPELGALLSFIAGILGLTIYCILGRVDFSQARHTLEMPWYYWLGGLLGAFYVLSLIILAPRLGVALTFGLTVAGQMIFGLILDHYGWLGLQAQPVSWPQMLGVVLIVAGVLMLRL